MKMNTRQIIATMWMMYCFHNVSANDVTVNDSTTPTNINTRDGTFLVPKAAIRTENSGAVNAIDTKRLNGDMSESETLMFLLDTVLSPFMTGEYIDQGAGLFTVQMSHRSHKCPDGWIHHGGRCLEPESYEDY